MDDPWDVKSVRQAGQYTSCMKLSGAPLLPPVLSKECRKEMQYYKLLAKEVEKRISILQPYVTESDSESNTDKIESPVSPECERIGELSREHVQAAFDLSIDKVTTCTKETNNGIKHPDSVAYDTPPPHIVKTVADSSKFVIDFSLSINQTGNVLETVKRKSPCPAIELPERDYNCMKTKELLMDMDMQSNSRRRDQNKGNVVAELPDPETVSCLDGPPSISSKSFTGSLNDLHSESVKPTELVRQSSYTLLNPSPQLLAHLEVESLNTGIEMSCISMSESLSNLSHVNKKRRSWDLESAKVKWSSMAQELKTKRLPVTLNKNIAKTASKTVHSPVRAKTVTLERNRRTSTKPTPKSEPLQKRQPSPLRQILSNVTIVKGPAPTKTSPKSPTSHSPKSVVSNSEDPAAKVRELYDKIQKQQLVQMAGLVEKQKREQMLLQQVFEEQNSLLYKQLKTIVPKASVEAKEAWGETEADRGPVSLSQLINHHPERNVSPISCTLTDTNRYINECDTVLRKSRDLSGSIKKPKFASQAASPKVQLDGSKTRTHSPVRSASPIRSNVQKNTSRKLNYDTTSSYDPILTDRTNDTMADLNVSFPTDISDCEPYSQNNKCFDPNKMEVKVIHSNPPVNSSTWSSTDSAINYMERTIQNSINNGSTSRPKSNTYYPAPSPRELAAAAKIVAYAKGFLVRRLMRTERVTATVQTIRDALLCALQLHQDREGIRGADVDLHRRLIQQITAACYSLHDTFITSSAAERCAVLAADRARRRSLAYRQPPLLKTKRMDVMSQSHSGVFPSRPKRHSASLMTQSTYENYSSDKARRSRYMPSPRRSPWR